ncbi:apovitellenin-1-like [Varanus komodoensis]|uniref:Apovitellenin-1 n=1 Tax=Varanus komodoensis TaxID=61221 RepID=A0A8D2Q8G9_VARKO|nr:apovitellenin-1-like [Varanus komodoensis]
MLQSKVSAVVFIFLLGSMLTEADAKPISKRHVRRDWLIIPDTIALHLYNSLNKVSPKAAEFVVEVAKALPILEIRNFLIKETARISVLAEQLAEKARGLRKQEVNEPTLQ